MIGKRFAFLPLLAVTSFTPPLLADNVADPTAAALFRKGRELVESGQWEKGCEQFRASLARHEAASTVLNIARCEEHFGRVASAWALFQRGLVLARGEPGTERREALEKIAREGIVAMEPRLPKLRVVMTSPPRGLEISESSRPLPLGEAVPLDPGSHELVARAPGFETLNKAVVLEEGKTAEIAIELRPATEAKPAEAKPPEPTRSTPPPAAPSPSGDRAPDSSGVPAWAWISGGVGLAFLGVATAFALDASAQRDKLREKCGSDFKCDEDLGYDPAPTNARKNRSLGLAIGFGSAGVVALGASIFGIASAGSRSERALGPRLSVSKREVWVSADFDL